MFIGRGVRLSTNTVRRSGIQVEVHHSRSIPLLRTVSEVFDFSIYKHSTPNGVKAGLVPNDVLFLTEEG